MNLIKKLLKSKHCVVWFSVTCVLLVILLVASILLNTTLSGFMNWFFGGDRHVKAGSVGNDYYTTDEGITDKASAVAAGNAINERICEEGFVLLKNNDGLLPLSTSSSNKAKISVFGKNSVNLAYGSAGSVGGDTSKAKTIFDSLTAANFEYNTVLESFYKDTRRSGNARPSSPSMSSNSIITGFATGETPVASYSETETNSFRQYNDAALVVITRVSGENYDLPLTMKNTDGAMSESDHYLELDQNEQDMLKMVCDNFDKVVLIINSSTPLELGFLDEEDDGDSSFIQYDFAGKIKAALWIGMPGETGIMALGRILNGTVNPSGRTVDLYARDFTSIPAVVNFSCNGEANSDSYYLSGSAQKSYFIDYEEGIYVGYKYFETRGYDEAAANNADWYDKNVVYPFGYGLSYTTFTQKINKTNISETFNWTASTELSITVDVTNNGSVAGKDVVQIYATPEYFKGGIEKAHKVLVGYAKTEMIPAGATKSVTVTFNPYDFASYDFADKNANGVKGYELEAGDYTFSVGKNSHEVFDTVTTTLSRSLTFGSDTVTGYAVQNRFDDLDDQLGTQLSRADWDGTFPKMRTAAEKETTQEFLNSLNSRNSGNPLTADDETVKQALAAHPYATVKEEEGMQLWEIIGVEYDTDDRGWNELWDKMLSRITLSSVWSTLSDSAFNTPAIDYILKPQTVETDGPAGFVKFAGVDGLIFDTCFYASECVLSSTWNDDLAFELGNSIGNEGLIGNGKGTPYSGWYAPGMNIHRTPFGGRNPEYYSEDGCLSGNMAAQVIQGAASKGVYTFAKHFIANEQETHRGGVCTWLTEQALRETYMKPFEIAVKKGKTTAIMSSFNRLGSTWTGGDYRLLTEVLRNEWGFKGSVICDFASGQGHMDFKQMVYAGGDLWLDTIAPTKWYDANNALDVYMLQESMKHCLYTVANSNAMNGIGEGTIYKTALAYWKIVLIIVDVVVPVGLAVWGFFAIRGALKKKENNFEIVSTEQNNSEE